MTLNIVVLIIFAIVIIYIGAYGYKISAKTAEDFMLASRALGLLVMFFFVLFAISSAWTFYGYPGYMHVHGPGYAYFIWGAVTGFTCLFFFIGPRLWAVTRMNRYISPLEALGERYEMPALRFVLAVILLIYIVPYICVQLLGIGVGLEALTGFPVLYGALYFTAIMLAFIILGGMRTVAWANVLFGLLYALTFFGALVGVIIVGLPEGGIMQAVDILKETNPEQLSVPGPHGEFTSVMLIGTIIVGFLSLSWPHIVIQSMTARDKAIFKYLPILLLVFGGLFFYTVPYIFGAIISPALMPELTGAAADNAVQLTIMEYLPGFGLVAILGVAAAAISSASIQLMTSSIFMARDIIHGFLKPDMTERSLVTWTRVVVAGLVFLSLGLAMWNPTALGLYLTDIATPGFAQWAPALIGGILWKRGTGWGAMVGTVAGSVYLIASFFLPQLLFDLHPVLPSIALNIILYVVVSLLTEAPSEEVETKFFDEVDEYLSASAD